MSELLILLSLPNFHYFVAADSNKTLIRLKMLWGLTVNKTNIGKQEPSSDFRNNNQALSVVQGSDCCSDIRGKPVRGFCGAIGLRPGSTDFTHTLVWKVLPALKRWGE